MDGAQSNASNEHAWPTDRETLPTGKVYGTGFNAHSQLNPNHTTDLHTFEKLSENGTVLYTSWATTILVEPTKLRSLGHMQLHADADLPTPTLQGGFGNHERMTGCMSDEGKVAIAHPSVPGGQECVLSIPTAEGPLLSHVAVAGNGRVAVTYRQAPNGRLCHVSEFEDEGRFLRWLGDPSGQGNYPARHHMLPGRPKQLLACAVSFLLLMEGGEVYSWGDPRHRTLGRSLAGQADSAEQPAAVEALGGLRIRKIACGGWMSAALSADGAVYVWGGKPPGAEQSIEILQNRDAGDVALVEIAAGGEEPLEFADVAVGDAHIAVVTQDGELFVVGSNGNGQLGIGGGTSFADKWQAVSQMHGVVGVVCGPKTTFALTR